MYPYPVPCTTLYGAPRGRLPLELGSNNGMYKSISQGVVLSYNTVFALLLWARDQSLVMESCDHVKPVCNCWQPYVHTTTVHV